MRAKEFIVEGQGLRAARPNEVYSDANGVEYEFQSWNWDFPPAPDLQYPDTEELEAGILLATNQNKHKIHWVNPNSSTRAKSFAYAIFAEKQNNQKVPPNELWIGKFFDRKNPNNTIQDKDVKAVLGLSAAGKSSAIKAESALQPGQLGLADNRARGIGSIITVVSGHAQGAMLTASLTSASTNQPIVFKDSAGIAGALQDDFCEVVAPIAMLTGHTKVTGHLAQAFSDVFGGQPKGATISFPADQNNPLVDSYIILNKVSLGVSHKGKQGAKATITNIWKAKDEAAKTTSGAVVIAKYPEAVEILDICKRESGLEQPITLGLRYQIIDQTEATALESLLENPRDPAQQLVGDAKNPNAVNKRLAAADAGKVPQTLTRIFSLGGYKSGSYVGFLCLARVAKLVADHINKDANIDFGEAIRSFLNSSAMVQAKSSVSPKGQDAEVKQINIVYPPNFTEKATIESNGYSGTQVKGKFSFSLPTT
jgi:hypothetical protein